jgi:hypothetical protein
MAPDSKLLFCAKSIALCGGSRLLAAAVMMVFAAIGTFADSSLRFASAQEEMSSDFREILSDDGQWVTHPRWGEV